VKWPMIGTEMTPGIYLWPLAPLARVRPSERACLC
jgi:hypothetical protein